MEGNNSWGLSSNFCDPEVYVLILCPFELQLQRNAFSFYLDHHFVETVNVKDNIFIVSPQLPRIEYNWHSQHVLLNLLHISFLVLHTCDFNWQDHLSWRDLYVQVITLLVERINWNWSSFSVADLKIGCDGQRLFKHETWPEIIRIKWEIDSWYFGISSKDERIGWPWDNRKGDRCVGLEGKLILRRKN